MADADGTSAELRRRVMHSMSRHALRRIATPPAAPDPLPDPVPALIPPLSGRPPGVAGVAGTGLDGDAGRFPDP
jgi:hypothetical protein